MPCLLALFLLLSGSLLGQRALPVTPWFEHADVTTKAMLTRNAVRFRLPMNNDFTGEIALLTRDGEVICRQQHEGTAARQVLTLRFDTRPRIAYLVILHNFEARQLTTILLDCSRMGLGRFGPIKVPNVKPFFPIRRF